MRIFAFLSRKGRKRPRFTRRGMALILVLSALTLLTVMLTELQDESSAELSSAVAVRDAVVAEYAARSAVNLSRLLIAAEPTIRAPIAPLMAMLRMPVAQIPVWEFGSKILGAFNDKSGAEEFASLAGLDPGKGKNLGFEGAGFEVRIIDEDSKINFNAAASGNPFSQLRLGTQIIGLIGGPQYSPLFEQRDPDGQFSERRTVCSAIIDFADPDQESFSCDMSAAAQQAGAEDSFYQLLKKPYQRKNAPYDSLEELHRVRGISDDFWATFIEPDPDRPEKRVVTVWGQSAVNVNTANPQALLAVICGIAGSNPPPKVCVDPTEQMKLLSVLTMVRSFAAGVPLFSTPQHFINALQQKDQIIGPMLKMLGMEPVIFQSPAQAAQAVTVESKMFSIYAMGRVKAGRRETRVRVHAVVDFRSAPPPGMAPMQQPGQPGTVPPATSTQLPQTPPPTGGQNNPVAGALRPSPAGNVIYYRVD